MRLTTLLLLLTAVAAVAQTAPPVTGIQAINHDGQTFITWTDAATGTTGANYRYDLYRSTSGPITNLSSATLVQQGIYNNSAQLIGPKPFDQTTRQDTDNLMSKIQNGGTNLPLWSGVAVYTNFASAKAYYAVITRDITGVLQPSPLSDGSNSMKSAVTEAVAAIQPVLQVPSSDPSRFPFCCEISGTPNLPFWLKLHGSDGRAAPWGDYQAYWGNSTMGYQDGVQAMFSVYEDDGSGIALGGVRQLIMTPQDAVWSVDGSHEAETYWFGNRDIPIFATDRTPHIYPFTQAKLALIVPWAIQHYNANPNRIYGADESMGGFGHLNWALRLQPDVFAAIFLRIPVVGPWKQIPSLIDLTAAGAPRTVATTTDTLPDGVTLYNTVTNTPAWVAQNCGRTLPYVSWSSGRLDQTIATPPYTMWTEAVALANALRTCRYGFSFIWDDDYHESSTGKLENTLLTEYQTMFAKNLSYPAFVNFSLDGTYGDGSYTDGALSGCVNCGWTWKVTQDTGASWSATFSNSQVSSTATVDVTIRNAQSFKPSTGTSVAWAASSGQQGTVTVDANGLVTVTAIDLSANGPTTITFAVK